jgi:hypothetical protein
MRYKDKAFSRQMKTASESKISLASVGSNRPFGAFARPHLGLLEQHSHPAP